MILQGKTVLITGAARRVGAAIAVRLHAAGANIAIHYHQSSSEATLLSQQLQALRPDSVLLLEGDLKYTDQLPTLIEKTLAHFGSLYALINNASVFYPTTLEDMTGDQWAHIIGINLKTPLFLAKSAVSALRKTEGCIVNISDIHVQRPLPGYPLYNIAKSGLDGMTRTLAIELAPKIRVNGLALGAIAWPSDGQISPPEQQHILSSIPLKRIGGVSAVAQAVYFLVAEAEYITGQVLAVDGGRSINGA